MSDEYADAFEELLDAQEEARGKRITVKIGTQDVDAIIEKTMFEPMHLMGGEGHSGGFKAICPISRFKAPPAWHAPIIADGYPPLAILSCEPVNGATYEITAGDPTGADDDR